MAPKDFTATFLVDQTPEEAFKAINNVRGWWSEEVEGATEKLNDEFVFQFKDIHYSKQRLIEVVPGKRVVWLVTESRLNFIQDKEEWTGTTISFEIVPKDNKTQVRFTHHGLVPGGECFDACSNAWTDYITGSLRDLIATGKGQPALKENQTNMKIKDKTILVTGANRGIGRALVEEALKRGAKRIYAGTRTPFTHTDPRVVNIPLDVTDEGQIRKAAASIDSLDILINNAGVAFYDNLSDRAMIEQHLAVNLFGMYDLTQAFMPLLIRSKGAIVNNLSIVALAAFPPIPSYSISKAAAFSLTQSLRAFLAGQGVRVHAILTGPVDTDMNRGLDIPKAPPELAAAEIFDGVERGDEEIFPDPMSASMAESWRGGVAKAMERQNAAAVAG